MTRTSGAGNGSDGGAPPTHAATELSVQDLEAAGRDRAADQRDADALRRDARAEDRRASRDARADRVAAAGDRRAAAADRACSARDRVQASQYRALTYLDELTGALQRRAGREQLAGVIARARRDLTPVIVMFVDVDHLKKVNDTAGHAAGDALLWAVAQALRDGLRPYDVVVRYGGDEFVCALPGASFADAGDRLATVRELLTAASAHGTVSVGAAELRPSDSLDDVVGRADRALYASRLPA